MNFSDSCGVSYCRDTTLDTGTRVYACWSPHQSTREKERDLLWLTIDQLVLGLATQSMRVNQVTYIHSRNLRLSDTGSPVPLIGSSLGMRRQLKIIMVHLKTQTCLYHLRGSIKLNSLVRYCSLPLLPCIANPIPFHSYLPPLVGMRFKA